MTRAPVPTLRRSEHVVTQAPPSVYALDMSGFINTSVNVSLQHSERVLWACEESPGNWVRVDFSMIWIGSISIEDSHL